jgi:glucan phosphoethanolaminetransferase (alkaline phosphatase superfamily)
MISTARGRLFPINPEALNTVVVLFILIVNNKTMFSRAAKLAAQTSTLVFLAVMALGLTSAIVTIFSYFGWVWVQKIGLATLLILSAVTAHYTDTLGAVFDEEMVNNILSTHASEGASLINVPMCQRQSKSEPKGSAKCCHFGVGEIAA